MLAHVYGEGTAEVTRFEKFTIEDHANLSARWAYEKPRDARKEPAEPVMGGGNHVVGAALSGKLDRSLIATRCRSKSSKVLLVEGDVESNLGRFSRFGDLFEQYERLGPLALILQREGTVKERAG
jgi:hypothetical protein